MSYSEEDDSDANTEGSLVEDEEEEGLDQWSSDDDTQRSYWLQSRIAMTPLSSCEYFLWVHTSAMKLREW